MPTDDSRSHRERIELDFSQFHQNRKIRFLQNASTYFGFSTQYFPTGVLLSTLIRGSEIETLVQFEVLRISDNKFSKKPDTFKLNLFLVIPSWEVNLFIYFTFPDRIVFAG
uniref:Uncharacterized protein n=1 Tax=Schistocephalus solidus TaxID=70667 RepID=A0A0X3NUN6_SCHSO